MLERSILRKTTHLYLVRHGRTDWNALRRLQGKIERELDEEGRRQAQDVGTKFSREPLSAVYSSAMIRAKQTAEIIAAHHSLEIRTISDLHEGSYGPLDGMFIDEFERRFADAFVERKSLKLKERFCYRLAEGVETNQEIIQRVLPHLHKICLDHPGEKVLVVTHGWVMRAVILYLTQSETLEVSIRNGGDICLHGDGESLSLINYEEAMIR